MTASSAYPDQPIASADSQASSNSTPRKKFGITWSKRNRIIAGIVGVIVLFLAAGLAYSYWPAPATEVASDNKPAPTPTPTPTPVPKDHPNPLNGVLYTAQDATQFANLRPLAVMVENHVDARPQSGLNEADILYEAMAEGGITRFMAIYLAGHPDKVGPVRSARLHFVDWASEYDAIYAHWGGSAEALAFLQSHNRPINLDEFTFGGAFYRDTSSGKALEHTGYTSVPSLRSVASKNGWDQAVTFHIWPFKDDAPADKRPQAQTVNLSFLNTPGYQGSFTYRPDTNDYVRNTGGVPHLDSSGQQLTAKTVILQFQNVTNYTDTNGHAAVRVQTQGAGKAVVIQDGTAAEGSWNKASQTVRTTYTDANGQEIPLNRGKIWIVSVPVGSAVSY